MCSKPENPAKMEVPIPIKIPARQPAHINTIPALHLEKNLLHLLTSSLCASKIVKYRNTAF